MCFHSSTEELICVRVAAGPDEPAPSATFSVHWPVRRKGYIFPEGSIEGQMQGHLCLDDGHI